MSASGAAAYLSGERLRRGVQRRKVFDKVFVLVGLIVMLACLAVLAILFIDLIRDGAPRFNLDFFTNFASRKAERGMGRHFADHARDRHVRGTGRRRSGDLPRRIRAEELVHGGH
jgi:hypothetical protein